MFTIGEIIDLAIQIETNGEKTYRNGQRETDDPALSSLLGWLADQEKEHIEWFSNLNVRIDKSPVTTDLDRAARDFLRGVLGGQTFSLGEIGVSKQEGVISMLETSLEFEKDTILFYEMVGEFVEDTATKRHLKTIISEEEDHVKLLGEYLDRIRRMVRVD